MKYTRFVNKKNSLAVAIAVFLVFQAGFAEAGKISDILKRVGGSVVSPKKTVPASASVKSVKSGVFSSPLETVIVSGPEQGSFVQDTKVEFNLDGWEVLPFKKLNRFEVWLIGVDTGWRGTASRVVYKLPAGVKTYTFLARSKNASGVYDVTAAVRSFTIYTSPYFGQIEITNIQRRGGAKEPQNEKFSLYARGLAGAVNVSGWKITVKRSSFSFAIPSAQKIYNPRSPYNTDLIVLAKGGYLDFFVGERSPLGVNFEENSCEGYLSGVFGSYDSLRTSSACQLPPSSSYSRFSADCRKFINGITNCRKVDLAYYQFINEPSCRDFIIKNYNYQACVERNRSLAGFFSGRWRAYLGHSEEMLDDLNDTIYLHDNKGLLVASAGY